MSEWRVPLTDIAMPEQDVQAVADCLRSGWLTLGPRTQAFEGALAGHVGTPHVVAAYRAGRRHGGRYTSPAAPPGWAQAMR